jgi:hypothetical protein
MAINLKHTVILDQTPISPQWASISHRYGHPSTRTAYNYAMAWMQASITFAPTLDAQHSPFIAMMEDVKVLSFDYTSYQIHIGRLKRAIETLERGRVLLWTEMRSLRTSVDGADSSGRPPFSRQIRSSQ